MHKNLRLVYITTQSSDEAKQIGRKIIEQNLAACVNIIPVMTSLYRWKGKIQNDEETILLVKTHTSKIQNLTQFVKKVHPYDCPCVISLTLAEDEGNEEYLNWLLSESKDI
ncbi:MAG: divalent-cation tolerance protein CutA [Balneola sp.]